MSDQSTVNNDAQNMGQGTFQGIGGKSINMPITSPADVSTGTEPSKETDTNGSSTTSELVAFATNTTLDKMTSNILLSKYDNKPDGLFFNKSGDLVNEKGEVLTAKSDYEKEVATIKTERTTKATDYISSLETVTLADNTEGTINANGEVVDATGKVVMTKEQLTAYVLDNVNLDSIPSDESMIDLVSKLSGFVAVDEKGLPVTFDDTPEGLAKREAYIINQEATKLAQAQFQELLNTYPGVDDAINYIKVNGNLDGFGIKTSYENVTFDAKNETQQFNLIVEAEMATGKTLQEATDIANLFKDNDKLLEQSKKSLDRLKLIDKNAKVERAKLAADAEIEYQNELKKQTVAISNVIKVGKVLNYTLPEVLKVKDDNGVYRSVSKDVFIDYLTKPLNNGYTKEQLDASEESLERKIFFGLLRFTKDDLSQLVSSMADSKQVERFRSSAKSLNLGSKQGLVIKPTTQMSEPSSFRIKSELGAKGSYDKG